MTEQLSVVDLDAPPDPSELEDDERAFREEQHAEVAADAAAETRPGETSVERITRAAAMDPGEPPQRPRPKPNRAPSVMVTTTWVVKHHKDGQRPPVGEMIRAWAVTNKQQHTQAHRVGLDGKVDEKVINVTVMPPGAERPAPRGKVRVPREMLDRVRELIATRMQQGETEQQILDQLFSENADSTV